MENQSRKDLIIWAAGFIDGEGYIGISRRPRNTLKFKVSHNPVINVGQVQIKPLKILKSLFGGYIYTPKKHKYKINGRPTSQWIISSRGTEQVIKEIFPYLVCKKQEAKLVLSYYETCLPRKIDKKLFNKREKLFKKLKTIRKRKYGQRH